MMLRRWFVKKGHPALRDPRISVDRSVRLQENARLTCNGGGQIAIGAECRIDAGAYLATHGGTITLGRRCSVNAYAVLYGHGGLDIGDNVLIAAHAVIVPANHVFADPDMPIRDQGLTREGIVIEDDVWIGTGARVLDGVRIARGCVIAAGAVVTASTEPMGVYAGVPARRISERG